MSLSLAAEEARKERIAELSAGSTSAAFERVKREHGKLPEFVHLSESDFDDHATHFRPHVTSQAESGAAWLRHLPLSPRENADARGRISLHTPASTHSLSLRTSSLRTSSAEG